jgi:hypothetical protein
VSNQVGAVIAGGLLAKPNVEHHLDSQLRILQHGFAN